MSDDEPKYTDVNVRQAEDFARADCVVVGILGTKLFQLCICPLHGQVGVRSAQ
jgi:hypothetical protein